MYFNLFTTMGIPRPNRIKGKWKIKVTTLIKVEGHVSAKKKKALIDLQYKKKVWKGTFFASESASKKHTKMTYTCRYCFEKKLNQWLSTKIIKEFTDGISIIFL